MKRIDRDGIPPGRSGLTYVAFHGAETYPPKLVVSFAHEEAFGRPLSPALFTGGPEVNGFLRRLGFTVVRKDKGPDGVTPARTQRRVPVEGAGASIPQPSGEGLAALRAELLGDRSSLYTWAQIRTDKQRPRIVPASTPGSLIRSHRAFQLSAASPVTAAPSCTSGSRRTSQEAVARSGVGLDFTMAVMRRGRPCV